MPHYSLPLLDWQNVAAIFVRDDLYLEHMVQLGQQFCHGHQLSSGAADEHQSNTRHMLLTSNSYYYCHYQCYYYYFYYFLVFVSPLV